MACEARDDVYQWCKSYIIEGYTSHWALSVGDKWWEMGHSQDEQAKAQTLKFLNFLGPQVVG